MSNPNCSQVYSRASTATAGTVGLFEGAHYSHCGAYRPEYDCKMRNLGVPLCRVCRQVIWNRLGPLATLPGRTKTPLQVIAHYPEHLDVFGVAADGRTLSNWWDQSSGWAGWSRYRVASPLPAAPAPRSRQLPVMPVTLICSISAPTTGCRAAGGMRVNPGPPGSTSLLEAAWQEVKWRRFRVSPNIWTFSLWAVMALCTAVGGMPTEVGPAGSSWG